MRALIKSLLPAKLKKILKNIRDGIRVSGSLDREFLSYRFLEGNGIEIGALHNPLKVSPKAKVKYVDRYGNEGLAKHYPEQMSESFVKVDIIDNGELLETIEDNSQDFVIANHFIEHCQNPLLTLSHMHRVLKEKGILYLALPDKRYTFDKKRPVTPLEHLFKDYHEGPEHSKRQHFEEWVSLVNQVLIEEDYSIHFPSFVKINILHNLTIPCPCPCPCPRPSFCFQGQRTIRTKDNKDAKDLRDNRDRSSLCQLLSLVPSVVKVLGVLIVLCPYFFLEVHTVWCQNFFVRPEKKEGLDSFAAPIRKKQMNLESIQEKDIENILDCLESGLIYANEIKEILS